MNCKDNCLHYEVCAQFSKADGANHEYYDFSNQAEKCECFKDCHRGINDERLTPTADVAKIARCKDCMTDNEIIKALECLCWNRSKCRECPYSPRYEFPLCQWQIAKDSLDLIKRQKAEADSAKAKIKICAEVIERQDAEIERLKNRISEQKAYTADLQNKIVKLKDYNENLLAANTGLSN